jgi:hypothetical protein
MNNYLTNIFQNKQSLMNWKFTRQKGKKNFIFYRVVIPFTIFMITLPIFSFYLDNLLKRNPAMAVHPSEQFTTLEGILTLGVNIMIGLVLGYLLGSWIWNNFEKSYQSSKEKI